MEEEGEGEEDEGRKGRRDQEPAPKMIDD